MNTLKELVTHPNVTDVNYMQGVEGIWSCTVWDREELDNEILHSDDLEDLSRQVQSWLDTRKKAKSIWNIVCDYAPHKTLDAIFLYKDGLNDICIVRNGEQEWITKGNARYNYFNAALAGRSAVSHPRALRFLDMALPEEQQLYFDAKGIAAHDTNTNVCISVSENGRLRINDCFKNRPFGRGFTKQIALVILKAIKEGWIDLEASDD